MKTEASRIVIDSYQIPTLYRETQGHMGTGASQGRFWGTGDFGARAMEMSITGRENILAG
jgi:hypothetical protein